MGVYLRVFRLDLFSYQTQVFLLSILNLVIFAKLLFEEHLIQKIFFQGVYARYTTVLKLQEYTCQCVFV